MAESESDRSASTTVQPDRTRKEKKSKSRKKSDEKRQETETNILTGIDIPECAVCLQSCVHPVKLPCDHIFCFLCVKGVANQSKRCALCRKEIPIEFLNCPVLVKSDKEEAAPEPVLEEGYQWFYEGRNGWWQYDERASVELEDAYKQKHRCIELLIAGFLYVVDFENMIQIRRNDPTRRRRIKRDLFNVPKKGVAGIKYFSSEKISQDDRQGDGDEETEDGVVPATSKPQMRRGDGSVGTVETQFSNMTVSGNDAEDESSPSEEEDSSDDHAPGAAGGPSHQSIKTPTSLVNMSSGALHKDNGLVLPQGMRQRRQCRRQPRNANIPTSRQESSEPERTQQRSHNTDRSSASAQYRYDGDVESSDDEQ